MDAQCQCKLANHPIHGTTIMAKQSRILLLAWLHLPGQDQNLAIDCQKRKLCLVP